MSVTLPLIIATATANAAAPPAEPLRNAITVAVPSLDGMRGLQVGYERWMPTWRISVGASAQLRQAAVGDYTGLRAGVGVEARWYMRTRGWLSNQPRGSMVGWFLGARFDVALDATHDDVSDRLLGTTMSLGATSLIGYRITPWRHLEITPTVGLTRQYDVDTSGRLPAYNHGSISAGLSLGWLF